LYDVIRKYNIISLLDAPCGSMAWMPYLIENITHDIPIFRYHGVDVVESIINSSKAKYSNKTNWKLEVLDITSQELPDGYDLIFSRDALQHLSLVKVIDSLKLISRTQGSRYLLVGSYLKTGQNKNIEIGDYFPIDLTKPPFNLNKYLEIFDEKTYEFKHLILYDIKNYLRFVNFDQMYYNIYKD
jgi:hypothetical protein